jgi:Zn-dependent protease/predicted transcriptional regulator
MPFGGMRIGRIGGIPIRADFSFLLIAVFFAYINWLRFDQEYPSLSGQGGLALAMLATILFFASILFHELGHAGVYRAMGVQVLGITLWMLGGATYANAEARRPWQEALVAAVGPGSSAAIGGVFLVAVGVLGGPESGPLAGMFKWLGEMNLLLAAFNALPGYPLDGGQLVRSGLWKLTGSRTTATHIAARIGQGAAVLFIALGLWSFATRQAVISGLPIAPLGLALIGWFLLQAAGQSIRDESRRGVLRRTTARDVMGDPPPTIPGDWPVSEALDRYLRGHEGKVFPVMDGGALVGWVSLEDAVLAARDRPVREAATQVEGIATARPDETLETVLRRLAMGSPNTSKILVLDGDLAVGAIDVKNLSSQLERGLAPAGRRSVDGSDPWVATVGPKEVPPRPDL